MQTSRYIAEVQSILSEQSEQDGKQECPPDTPQPLREIDVYIEDDRITFIPKTNQQEQVIDSEKAAPNIQAIPKPLQSDKGSERIAYAVLSFSILMLVSILILQIYFLFHPPSATVTIIPRSQTISLTGTLQLGRLLNPITISQSQSVPTTGKGHQYPQKARGSITFYNGQLQMVRVPAGTILPATNGVQVITDQDALIPHATPPIEGQTTITSHAVSPGRQGNIPSKAMDEACCGISVLAVNFTAFYGGADERTFPTVAKQDIEHTAQPLKTSLSESVPGALQSQVTPQEQLYILPCAPTVTSDHPIGEEAKAVEVTVSTTCSGVAYDNHALEEKATALLTRQARQKIGTLYTLLGSVAVTVYQAQAAQQTKGVKLFFHAQGTWIYSLSDKAQQHLKRLIAGKTKQSALAILNALPGIASASIQWRDATKLPKDPAFIHFQVVIHA